MVQQRYASYDIDIINFGRSKGSLESIRWLNSESVVAIP